jgi:hypothetical protein
MGVEATNLVGHKRFLALFAGGMLPMISLSFLHMLVKFTEEDRLKEDVKPSIDKQIQDNIINADLADESARLKLTERDLEILQRYFENPPEPNDALKAAAKKYKENLQEQPKVNETPSKEKIDEILSEMMRLDQELGLYDEPFDNPLIKDEVETVVPALSDEEVMEMNQDEYERKLDTDDEIVSTIEPTEEEEQQNFYTIDLNAENSFQDTFEDYEGQEVTEPEETGPVPFETVEEVQKYNIDDSIPREEEFQEINNDSFWRDHIQEDEDDDLKKKS